MLLEPGTEHSWTRLQFAATEEQAAFVFVLAFGDRMLDLIKAQFHGNCRGAHAEAIVRRRRRWIEQRIEHAIELRRTREALSIDQEIAVEIDVVLVRAPQPGHTVGIQYMHEN